MKLLSALCLLICALASPAFADSITLKFTGLTITNASGQTATGSVMGGDLVASSGPLMIKTPTAATVATIGSNPFDTVWFIIAPNTPLASLNGYQFSFNTEVNGRSVGTVTATLSVRPDGVAVATILTPNLAFQGLDRFLQLSFSISPNPIGIGPGNYDIQATLSEVPEPGTLGLLSLGLLSGVSYVRRRRQRQ
ncbi:MAG TPA: PEP-CTERM sorting domain-containing protein [Blastocatellia bacterium]|nr:PEP-CTERM sorting domain-containing protein [Blastocatellia bacterium]